MTNVIITIYNKITCYSFWLTDSLLHSANNNKPSGLENFSCSISNVAEYRGGIIENSISKTGLIAHEFYSKYTKIEFF